MHPRLAVSAICSWGLSFDEDMALWADLGVDHVGLFLEKLERAGLDHAVARVLDAGLTVSTVACQGFMLDDPDSWSERRVALMAAADAADSVDAHCLFVTAGTPGRLGWDDSVAALREALEPVHAHATGIGVPVAVEHTNPMRRDIGFIHTLRDMVEVARLLDVGVVVEITNCWAERGLEETIADGADTFSVVQVSDYRVGTVTATERAVPGDGDIPLAHLIEVIERAGFTGPFELEMLGPLVEAEGYAPAIARAVAALEPILTRPV